MLLGAALVATSSFRPSPLSAQVNDAEAAVDAVVPKVANGDVNGDGRRDLGDAIYLLGWLFQGGREPVKALCECPAEIGDPHPIFDLAGYLDPHQALLFVMPGHEKPILALVGAVPARTGSFLMNALTVDGRSYPLEFSVVPMDLPAVAVQDDGGPVQIGAEGRYKFYKNAKCVKVEDAFMTGCGGPIRGGPNVGKYDSVEWLEKHKCKKGEKYCTEVESISWIGRYFEDSECKVPLEIVYGKDFMCPPHMNP